jgi:L-arabinokinase
VKFVASRQPPEGLGALLLFRFLEDATPSFFDPDRRILVTRAPGRIELLGGMGSRHGGSSLQLTTAEAACAAIQARTDDLVRVWSPTRGDHRSQRIATRLGDLGVHAQVAPGSYEDARVFLAADPRDRWTAHALGGLLALAHECGLRPAHGFDLLIQSDVPEGRGAASSTAVTVAATRAIAALYSIELSATDCARLALAAAQGVAGEWEGAAPARAVVGAHADTLQWIDADGAIRDLALPHGLELVGLEVGVGRGPLAEVPDVAELRAEDGARIARFAALCSAEADDAARRAMGDLLFAAHDALVAHGRGHERTELVVELARERRTAGGPLLGATATGAACGGTVLLLGEHGKVWLEALRLKKALLAKTGHSAHVFRWSSPGAFGFEPIELLPQRG